MKKRGEIDARNDNDHTENYHKIKAEAEFLVQETIANCKYLCVYWAIWL